MKLTETIDRLIAEGVYAYRYADDNYLRTAYVHDRYDRLVCEYVDSDKQCDENYMCEPYGTTPTLEDLTADDWELTEDVYRMPDWRPEGRTC